MTYHAVTVKLENITGIVAQKDKSGSRTVSVAFNVTVAGKRHYAVVMRGAPRLENDMIVTAVLRDTENWQTLVGWLNHATGEVIGVDSPDRSLFVCVFGLIATIIFFTKQLDGSSSNTGLIFWLIVAAVLNVWLLLSWWKSMKVYKLLKP